MGRKIPGAKHHGVKDPIKQQERRMKLLKQKINAPPTNVDEQPIPKSLTRLLEFKEKHENKAKGKKNTKKTPSVPHEAPQRSVNPMSSLSRLPGESGRSFNQRINDTLHSITRSRQQTHEMERSLDPDKYLPEEDTKEERFDSIQRKKLKRKEKRERKEEGTEQGVKLSRMQRWAAKKKLKKAEKFEEQDESSFAPKYEHVSFGEVAHEPPSLHIKPRKAQTTDGAPRPGRRDLLLNKLLPSGSPSTAAGSVNKSARRKDLPVGVRMRLEQSQHDAIAAYRAIKAAAKRK